MKFEDPDLLVELEGASAELLDSLDFGVIRMKHDGTIVEYNRRELELSQLARERVIARNLFVQVAPCTNNFMVAERYAAESLDEFVEYVFTFVMRPTRVRLRLLKNTAHQYMLVKTL